MSAGLQFGHGFITRGGSFRTTRRNTGARLLQFGHGFITRGGWFCRKGVSIEHPCFNSATGSSPVEVEAAPRARAVHRSFHSATGSSPVEALMTLRGRVMVCDVLQFGHGFITRGGRPGRLDRHHPGGAASIRPRVHHPWRGRLRRLHVPDRAEASIRPRVHHPWRSGTACRRKSSRSCALQFGHGFITRGGTLKIRSRYEACKLQFGHGFITRGGSSRAGFPSRRNRLQFGHGFITRGGSRSTGRRGRSARGFNSATGSSPVEATEEAR